MLLLVPPVTVITSYKNMETNKSNSNKLNELAMNAFIHVRYSLHSSAGKMLNQLAEEIPEILGEYLDACLDIAQNSLQIPKAMEDIKSLEKVIPKKKDMKLTPLLDAGFYKELRLVLREAVMLPVIPNTLINLASYLRNFKTSIKGKPLATVGVYAVEMLEPEVFERPDEYFFADFFEERSILSLPKYYEVIKSVQVKNKVVQLVEYLDSNIVADPDRMVKLFDRLNTVAGNLHTTGTLLKIFTVEKLKATSLILSSAISMTELSNIPTEELLTRKTDGIARHLFETFKG